MTLKTGRNEPCWCGSGKKFKKCHWPNQEMTIKQERATFGVFGSSVREEAATLTPQKDMNLLLSTIETQKRKGCRPRPSEQLINLGIQPDIATRTFLLDKCGELVDENWCGRSEMCVYFAVLLRHAFNQLGIDANVTLGKAKYCCNGVEFQWDHAWVISGNDLIDGNVDSMIENPMIPSGIIPKNYWGPVDSIPNDRSFYPSRILDNSQDTVELNEQEILTWKIRLEKILKSWRTIR